MPHVAVRVECDEIAGDEPLAAKGVAFFLGTVPIAEHHAGIVAAHREQAGLARPPAASPPSLGSAATTRPGCGLPGEPGLTGVVGPLEMKVEISLMPKASKISLPVRARHSASRLGGSAAPAESQWRRLDSRVFPARRYFRIWR